MMEPSGEARLNAPHDSRRVDFALCNHDEPMSIEASDMDGEVGAVEAYLFDAGICVSGAYLRRSVNGLTK